MAQATPVQPVQQYLTRSTAFVVVNQYVEQFLTQDTITEAGEIQREFTPHLCKAILFQSREDASAVLATVVDADAADYQDFKVLNVYCDILTPDCV